MMETWLTDEYLRGIETEAETDTLASEGPRPVSPGEVKLLWKPQEPTIHTIVKV
jgi:hypothetical protein